jgi:hypothetical protein
MFTQSKNVEIRLSSAVGAVSKAARIFAAVESVRASTWANSGLPCTGKTGLFAPGPRTNAGTNKEGERDEIQRVFHSVS